MGVSKSIKDRIKALEEMQKQDIFNVEYMGGEKNRITGHMLLMDAIKGNLYKVYYSGEQEATAMLAKAITDHDPIKPKYIKRD